VDAILFEASEIATVFSFAHAYFLVDTPVPAALVEFLRSVIPMRSEAELYSAIGFHKQGKTSFYRQLLHHLRNSTDQFESAPGVRGMVMSVFTLPSFPYVFKVIRDRAQPPKTTTRSVVIQKYHLVKHHDRAGRMADTWEFSNVALPRARFSKALLEQLDQSCRSGIELRDDSVVIRHVYIERRMTPLDLYLSNATEKEADDIVYDYGEAIKQLAANNIFPGDMWLKNFGVTRTGRVVFYDYDEIVYLTECNFRRLPEMPDDLAALPMNDWFPVGADDVYPEEFAKFLCAHPRVACRLPQHHDDLMLPEYWQSVQQRVHAGRLPDLYPYPLERRFRRSRL
jgi:isocitrate dehydrogenase kinase/phosphatase